MSKYRVVYDSCFYSGKHRYFIEKWAETFESRMKRRWSFIFKPKPVYGWVRMGGGYVFDDATDAVRQCDLLSDGKQAVYERNN